MSERFYITAKGKDLASMSLASGRLLLGGMQCFKTSCDRDCCGYTYFYPEPAELRQRIADLKVPLTPVIAELSQRLAALVAPPANIPAELRRRLETLVVELAPAIADLRERIAALEGSLAPTIAEVGAQAGCAASLGEMERFVNCYEKVFADKTEWEPVYRLVSEGDIVEDCIEEDANSALPADADDSSASEGGESFGGQSVEWGDPSLMKFRYEKVPSRMHREPYIILW